MSAAHCLGGFASLLFLSRCSSLASSTSLSTSSSLHSVRSSSLYSSSSSRALFCNLISDGFYAQLAVLSGIFSFDYDVVAEYIGVVGTAAGSSTASGTASFASSALQIEI